MTEDRALEAALNLMGYNTDPFTREIFTKTIEKVKELGGDFTIRDYTKIKADACKNHGIDFETMRPIRHQGKKFYIGKPLSNGGFTYRTFDDEFTTNIEDAQSYDTYEFAERMIVDKELSGVTILTYFN
jgi:hypothetical protein